MLSKAKSRNAGRSLFFFLFIIFLTTEAYPQWVQTNGTFGSGVGCFTDSGTNLFAGTGFSGVFLSTDNGTSWTAINTGLTNTFITSLAVSGTNLFAGTGSGVFLSTNNGTSWTAVNTGLTSTSVSSFAVSDTNLFAGTDGGVFLSTNNGISWTAVNTGLTSTSVSSFAMSGTNLFAGTGGGVFLSTNNGTNWSAVNTGLTNTRINVLAMSGTNLFAGTYGGVFLSTNNGISWTEVNDGLPVVLVRDLAVSGTNLFAGYLYFGVFLSTNNGTSWTDINVDFTSLFLSFTVSGTNLFAGTEELGGLGGVWRRPLSEMIPVELTTFTASANGKEVTLNWSTATELNNQGFEVQRKFGSNDFVTIGSVRGNGTTTFPSQYSYVDKLIDAGKYFYRLKQIDYGGTFEYSNEIEVEARVLDKFTLEQNYPNPFNPTTKISWQSPVSSRQVLKVFDVLGNEVATIVDKAMDAGYHSIDFNASNLPSGVYFYQLQVGDFIETKKMILLR